jgi:DUF1009 family protein
VFIGSLTRPSFWGIWPDLKTLLLAPRIFRAFRGGDDHLVTMLGRIVEQHGFRILGAHEVAPEILVTEGPVGAVLPSVRDRQDIETGLQFLRAIGPFDVGQAVVVAGRRVLAVEAAEGTDRMLDRLAALRAAGVIVWPAGSGVLVKAPKPNQDRRIDLPSVGPRTVVKAKAAGLAGVAVVAGETIIADAQQTTAEADRAGLFVIGLPAVAPGP